MNVERRPPKHATDRVVMDLISAMRDDTFTSREQLVANFVRENLEATTEMTIAELSAVCGVSKPTVIRFCRTLACDGFRDFKLRLAQNIAVSQLYLHRSADASAATTEAAVERVLSALFTTANAARDQIDGVQFQAVRDILAASRQILFVGIGGGSTMVAIESANRFFRLGIPSYAQSDGLLLQMWAATLGPDDTLFAISSSGEVEEVVNAVSIAREYGANTACITKPMSRLADGAEHAIVVDLPEDTDIHKPTSLRYAHLIIIDALALSVAQTLSDTTTEYLRRIRASLAAFNGRTGPQPLGD